MNEPEVDYDVVEKAIKIVAEIYGERIGPAELIQLSVCFRRYAIEMHYASCTCPNKLDLSHTCDNGFPFIR